MLCMQIDTTLGSIEFSDWMFKKVWLVKCARLPVLQIDKNQLAEYSVNRLNSDLIVIDRMRLDGSGSTSVKKSFMDKVMCEAIVYLLHLFAQLIKLKSV
jgi:hypothetical protein